MINNLAMALTNWKKLILISTLAVWALIGPIHQADHNDLHESSCEVCLQLGQNYLEAVASIDSSSEPALKQEKIEGNLISTHIHSFVLTSYYRRGPPSSSSL